MMIAWIVIAFIVTLFLWSVFAYNRLVTSRNDVQNAWSQIDIQLKRRHDLIPNLVSAVRGYMDHEQHILEHLIAARSLALAAQKIPEKIVTEGRLSLEVKNLFAAMEAYPELKANQNVLRLQDELVSTENRIAFSRQLYNDLVANYMTLLQVFPDVLIASFFGFKSAVYFSASPDEQRPLPSVTVRQ
ncbi:MAG TPA: LemA family protein [Thermodesulfovibrionales bacterium]|nr:LemA family protein [Thermodesulfovibrionales bacterium]